MPTIKDIAREAGVSHGTVSNVINGRGNVSVEKIQLVWQAAEKLGYKVNSKAQSLRQGRTAALRCFCRASRTAAGRPCMSIPERVYPARLLSSSYIPPALWRPPRKTNCWLPLWLSGSARSSAVRVCWMPQRIIGQRPRSFNCTPFSGKPCTRKCYVCRVRSRANGNRHRLASAAERTAADWYFYRARRISGYRAVSKWIPDGLCG